MNHQKDTMTRRPKTTLQPSVLRIDKGMKVLHAVRSTAELHPNPSRISFQSPLSITSILPALEKMGFGAVGERSGIPERCGLNLGSAGTAPPPSAHPQILVRRHEKSDVPTSPPCFCFLLLVMVATSTAAYQNRLSLFATCRGSVQMAWLASLHPACLRGNSDDTPPRKKPRHVVGSIVVGGRDILPGLLRLARAESGRPRRLAEQCRMAPSRRS